MTAPQTGDKILVLKQRFLDLILREDKDLELRHQRLTPGRYYLAPDAWAVLSCSEHALVRDENGAVTMYAQRETAKTTRQWQSLIRTLMTQWGMSPGKWRRVALHCSRLMNTGAPSLARLQLPG